jgi:hypothetical protein
MAIFAIDIASTPFLLAGLHKILSWVGAQRLRKKIKN